MFQHPMVTFLDQRQDYGEDRWIGIGILKTLLAVVVFTEPKPDTIRIISHERRHNMKKESTAMKSRTKWDELKAMKDSDIDVSEVPEIDAKVFKTMVVRMPQPKELMSIRIDPDVLAWFRQQGARYQTRINAVLRAYVQAHSQ